MAFLNSIFLWGTLAAAGVCVPVVIHLLNRYKHRQLDWAAMELLRKALTLRSRQVQLEDILMLVLRCAAIALIALALARPTILGGGGKWLGGRQQVGVVVALDGSYSMSARALTSRWDKARQQIKAVFETLNPGDPVTLVVMGQSPRILLRNVGYDPDLFNKTVNEAPLRAEKLNPDECLDEVRNLVNELKAPVKECYIISDSQISTWGELHDKARSAITDIGKVARTYYLSAASGDTENLALTRFELAGGAMRKGTTARYLAEVKNFGRQTASAISVRLSVNDQSIDQRLIGRLEPGQSQAVPLFFRCQDAGDFQLKAELGSDAVAMDNQAFAVAHVRDQVRILCVDGSPSNQPYQGQTEYLSKALQPRRTGGGAQSLVIERITAGELPLRKLTEFHVVVLANVGQVPAGLGKPLRSFVEQGGGLVVFLGDRIESRDFSARMTVDGLSLLPGQLGQVVAGGVDGVGLEAAGGSHPLSRIVKSLPADLVGQARVGRFVEVKLQPGGQAVLNISGTPWPLLSEKTIGRGKVMLWSTTANRKWSELVVHPLYPILLSEMVTHLTEQPNERAVMVGQPLVLPLPVELAGASATVKNPRGVEAVVGVEKEAGQPVARFSLTDAPGFYQIKASREAMPLPAAVNVDTSESDITTLDGPGLAAVLKGLPLQVADQPDGLAEVIRTGRNGREMWRMLLLAALVMLALESFLAHRFSLRMSSNLRGQGSVVARTAGAG